MAIDYTKPSGFTIGPAAMDPQTPPSNVVIKKMPRYWHATELDGQRAEYGADSLVELIQLVETIQGHAMVSVDIPQENKSNS